MLCQIHYSKYIYRRLIFDYYIYIIRHTQVIIVTLIICFTRHVLYKYCSAQLAQLGHDFHGISNFPKIIGCVDGTHIEILAPSSEEHEFVNRKGEHSINVMVSSTSMTNSCFSKSMSLVSGQYFLYASHVEIIV